MRTRARGPPERPRLSGRLDEHEQGENMENAIRAATKTVVKEIPEEKRGPQLCWATLPGGSELCEGTAILKVYGLPFCEVHGAEVRAGALAELYFDAEQFLTRLDNQGVPEPNPAALHALRAAISELSAGEAAANDEEDAALLRAYPFRRDLVDEDFRDFDYEAPAQGGVPEGWCRHHRLLIHRLMRLAHEGDATYIVETLEKDREHVSQQLAYVMADYEERVGSPAL
jgi:hypothetical protein